MRDVVVIGAGMGGLSAAVALAARGLDVELLEAAPRVGGKVDVTVHDGVEMDTGPSVLTLPGVLDRVLRRSGSSLDDELALVRARPAFRYRFLDGVVFDVHVDLEETLASVRAALGTAAALELGRFLAYARAIWDSARDAFVFGPPPRARDLPRLFARRPVALLRVDPLRTMADAIYARVTEPHLRDVLLRYATYNGSSPWHAPATLNCIAHVELGLGVFGVRGGMAEIARVLARRAEAAGAALRTSVPVERILVEGGRVAGVALQGGGSVRARAVVVNADVAHLIATLLPGAERRLPPAARPSLSGHCLLVKAERRASRVAHEVWFPEVYREEMEDLFARGRPPRAPTLYLCAQEKAHLRRGWERHEPVFVMANAPPLRDDVDSDEEERFAQLAALREEVQRRLAAGGFAFDDEVVWERGPADLAARFPGTDGAIYGAASHGHRAAFQRPRNRVDEVPGLYLAGGSAHPGGGVPLCLQSGLTAADLLAEDLGAKAPMSLPLRSR